MRLKVGILCMQEETPVKRKSLVFVWDGKADTLGFMTVCLLRLKTTKQIHSFIVTGDGMDETMAIT